MKSISKDQLINILEGAYSIVDDYTCYFFHSSFLDSNTFVLQDNEGDPITFLYEGAEIRECNLHLIEDITGDLHVMTVLVAAKCEDLLSERCD